MVTETDTSVNIQVSNFIVAVYLFYMYSNRLGWVHLESDAKERLLCMKCTHYSNIQDHEGTYT